MTLHVSINLLPVSLLPDLLLVVFGPCGRYILGGRCEQTVDACLNLGLELRHVRFCLARIEEELIPEAEGGVDVRKGDVSEKRGC